MATTKFKIIYVVNTKYIIDIIFLEERLKRVREVVVSKSFCHVCLMNQLLIRPPTGPRGVCQYWAIYL